MGIAYAKNKSLLLTGLGVFKQIIEHIELPEVVLARGDIMIMVLFLVLLSFSLYVTPKGKVWFGSNGMKDCSLDYGSCLGS